MTKKGQVPDWHPSEWPECRAIDLKRALRRKHEQHLGTHEWIYIEELRTAVGNEKLTSIDAWAINTMPFRNMVRISYEIKISRSDFMREIKAPAKRKVGLMYSNQFYFVTPPRLILPSEVPAECGLIQVSRDGIMHTVVAAPWRDSISPSWHFLASVQRQIKHAAREMAMDELEHLKLQHAAALQSRIDDQNEAQDRARAAWHVTGIQQEKIERERKVVDLARKESGLPPIQWERVSREANEEYDHRWGMLGLGTRRSR